MKLTFQLLYTIKTPKLHQAIGMRPDGQALIGVIGNHTIATWEIRTGNLIQTLDLESTVQKIQIFRDGQTAIAFEANQATIWDIPTKRVLGRFPCARLSTILGVAKGLM